MLSVNPFSRFSGQSYVVIRYAKELEKDGIFISPGVQVLLFPGRIHTNSLRRNPKDKLGERMQEGLYLSSPYEYQVNVETKEVEADWVFYLGNFYRVEESQQYHVYIRHCQARASLVTHPPESLLELKDVAEAIENRKDLFTLADGSVFRLANNDLLTLW